MLASPGSARAEKPVSADEADGWTHVPINDRKPRTQYEFSRDGEQLTIHARAESSASLLMKPAAGIELARTPLVAWRWLVLQSPQEADIAEAGREDAAARLVFVFDGDRSRLPWTDRAVMATADRLGSRPMPFATLMYVTSSLHPVGSVLPNPYTRRVRMLVVDAQKPSVPASWQSFRRDLVADYKQAFGEAPGPLIAWGLMSDSDNTGSRAEAVYAPVRFSARD
ncbi:DUF3047 domain-containing protein [Paucibacter sp. B2R-40]|uniref:DUF3047 domain-containing protein n=1 Tax=Paucibacter sp. B2R-40 TaxID=2893554 RepID=UPI0021E5019C|nr:DUF3047 domain-containing protein [Paucibacter sp. B2R-40]MCV2357320.1 DUF3047 domain-containing protein [Paucibacter sp. B2R-40]